MSNHNSSNKGGKKPIIKTSGKPSPKGSSGSTTQPK